MRGDQDRPDGRETPAELPHKEGQYRSPDARAGGTDLDIRCERLAPSHPSSPHTGDGRRKPPVPDPFERELPLPGEPGAGARGDRTAQSPDGAGRNRFADSGRPRTGPDGSWEWKGRSLSPDESRIAERALARCRDAEGRDAEGNYGEHGLTPAMRRIEAQLEHGHLVDDTEKYALKSPDRFKEKLAKLIERYPAADADDLTKEIRDGIRYTLTFDSGHYTTSVEIGALMLTNSGYDHIETKPSWAAGEYKGVNTSWREPSGLIFEVQFHTPESWAAKQETHDAYEKISNPNTPVADVERLREYQREVSERIPMPPGALDIRPYKKEE